MAIFGLFFCFVIPLTCNLVRIQAPGRFREWAQSTMRRRSIHIILAGLAILLLITVAITRDLTGLVTYLTGIGTIVTGCMIYLMCVLEGTRNYLRSIIGVDFQDDQWGFGQVIAVFVWIPLCLRVTYFVIRVVSVSFLLIAIVLFSQADYFPQNSLGSTRLHVL